MAVGVGKNLVGKSSDDSEAKRSFLSVTRRQFSSVQKCH